jgi:[acyl-carrier-protein] S-malonyltransferase
MTTRAIVFAGQGAQAVGMGKDLADAYPTCRALFEQADAVLGYSISKICFEGPAEELTKTRHCQPAIFVASMAAFTALKQNRPNLTFAAAAGLSLGEWTALCAAGVLGFEDTLRILEARGRFMQDACDQAEGGMVSILGLTADALRPICEASGLEMANLKSAGQTVLSGPKAGIDKAAELAKAAGAKRSIPLKVAGAYHSSLMKPAAERLAGVLQGVTFRPPAFPVVANVTGLPHGAPESIRDTMVRQVTSSVRWQASVEWMKAAGVTQYIEFGPGKVLSGLVKQTHAEAVTLNVENVESLNAATAALNA